MIKTMLLAAALMLIAVLLAGIKVFFTRNGRFRSTHVGGNAALRKQGVGCVQAQDKEARIVNNKKIKETL